MVAATTHWGEEVWLFTVGSHYTAAQCRGGWIPYFITGWQTLPWHRVGKVGPRLPSSSSPWPPALDGLHAEAQERLGPSPELHWALQWAWGSQCLASCKNPDISDWSTMNFHHQKPTTQNLLSFRTPRCLLINLVRGGLCLPQCCHQESSRVGGCGSGRPQQEKHWAWNGGHLVQWLPSLLFLLFFKLQEALFKETLTQKPNIEAGKAGHFYLQVAGERETSQGAH